MINNIKIAIENIIAIVQDGLVISLQVVSNNEELSPRSVNAMGQDAATDPPSYEIAVTKQNMLPLI